ncbi:MAG: hypothetical protein CMJ67_02070 [Planctomycetaceae bacterium]|nr:hypothetical protein [Planctomycetaceae bacterium]
MPRTRHDQSKTVERIVMSTPNLNLSGSNRDPGGRIVVEVEFNAATGEIMGITGDQDTIRQTCSFLLGKVGVQGTRLGRSDCDGNHSDTELGASKKACGNRPLHDTATNPEALVDTSMSEREIRHRARPSQILAALRRERELSSQAALRLVGNECERELRSTPSDVKPTLTSPERELQAWVGPRDQRNLERDPVGHSPNTDARSGGNGNAAGSSTAGQDSRELTNDDLIFVSPPAPNSGSDAVRDAFPPRSSGGGHSARGFAGGVGDEQVIQGAPVGGASGEVTEEGDTNHSGDAAATRPATMESRRVGEDSCRGTVADRSSTEHRSPNEHVTGHQGTIRLQPRLPKDPVTPE